MALLILFRNSLSPVMLPAMKPALNMRVVSACVLLLLGMGGLSGCGVHRPLTITSIENRKTVVTPLPVGTSTEPPTVPA